MWENDERPKEHMRRIREEGVHWSVSVQMVMSL